MLDQIRDIEYDDLKGFDTSGDITESELARWSQRNALQKEANGLRQQAKALSGGGLSAADRIRDKASGINDPANNDGFLEAGEGVTAGLQSWVVATGSTGQQIAATLQSSVGGAISTISTGLHGLATGTQSWGDIGRSVMSMLLQQLIQLTVQQLSSTRSSGALGGGIGGAGQAERQRSPAALRVATSCLVSSTRSTSTTSPSFSPRRCLVASRLANHSHRVAVGPVDPVARPSMCRWSSTYRPASKKPCARNSWA